MSDQQDTDDISKPFLGEYMGKAKPAQQLAHTFVRSVQRSIEALEPGVSQVLEVLRLLKVYSGTNQAFTFDGGNVRMVDVTDICVCERDCVDSREKLFVVILRFTDGDDTEVYKSEQLARGRAAELHRWQMIARALDVVSLEKNEVKKP